MSIDPQTACRADKRVVVKVDDEQNSRDWRLLPEGRKQRHMPLFTVGQDQCGKCPLDAIIPASLPLSSASPSVASYAARQIVARVP